MNRLLILALTAVPTALLIGPAAPAPAADAPALKASATASSTCRVPAADEVLTAKESIRLIQQCPKAEAKTWHWMGNYGSVHDVVAVANQAGIGPGELITEANPSGGGLLPTFMFY
jgi:hypothetical protein